VSLGSDGLGLINEVQVLLEVALGETRSGLSPVFVGN
jgi:hypothetical protein